MIKFSFKARNEYRFISNLLKKEILNMKTNVELPTIILNAFRIYPKTYSKKITLLRIEIPSSPQLRSELSKLLKDNDIVYHFQSNEYQNLQSGYYIFVFEKFEDKIPSDLLSLTRQKVELAPDSYALKTIISSKIEDQLKSNNLIIKESPKSNFMEKRYCYLQDELEINGIDCDIFNIHRCFKFRVEVIPNPRQGRNDFFLIIQPSVKVRHKQGSSFKSILSKISDQDVLVGLPVIVKSEEKGISYKGYISGISEGKIAIRNAEIGFSEEYGTINYENPEEVYPIPSIYEYSRVLENLGNDYKAIKELYERVTFRFVRGKRMKDAPLQYLEEVKKIRKDIFGIIQEINVQNVIYKIEEEPLKYSRWF
jgi:hypothetical protein